ncbi:MAG TPA: NADH-quinone oxidoreductase subunit NuoB [Phycisphaerae bacterium]|jgi:NADH-quinone oxidoreductase subunit B|nr:NADH-quinone oxidoreductase subunit NuoB [Phycisphaerae bacterium]HOJ55660.1 NADH-quinone oxidoreductase subunit NuoB [Phycisphaerae bacterium]HOL27671.1 NADH-quinone oxidoreductase subunit NuoB [Phycisphaerae bacterium]HPP21973.1 NADH-quinone oxidoreductase subunit NuoB [Phycisphaerae bacterium]HPU33554.1 NADH-quinone oxidoreductase subunit NuoB [Phycisphaerae bacterium]
MMANEKYTYAPHTMSKDDFVTTRLDTLVNFFRKYGVNWCRKYSLWPLPFATACCGIEVMAVGASRYDIARFGAEAMRFSPRQADLLIVAGRVGIKMMPVLQRIYKQMTEPKWVISMGACASTGGVFDTYAVVQGVDQFMPVDVYVPGCPPRPETLIEGVMAIQRIVERDGIVSSTERGKGFRVVVEPTYTLTVPSRQEKVDEPVGVGK